MLHHLLKERHTAMFATLALLLSLALAALPLAAQTTAGQITGIISDPTGAMVAGASVTARNAATGATRLTTSNESGNYTIPLLEPGPYSVTVQKEGFRTAERTGINLSVNATIRLDMTMTLGAVNDSISVNADAPLLDADQSSLGTVVDNRKVTELPLNGRNPFDLAFLTPGTVAYNRLPLPGNNIPLTNFSINGSPTMSNEVLLDGIPDTSPQFNQFAIIPSIDAVQEFKVQTNNMSAEFGRTSGGVVNVSMRGGTNVLHGSLYEFLRNSAFDSNNWFNNASGQKRPPFRFNQFGGTVGAPIRKDKTFFFFNYEGMRRRTGRTLLFSVPTADHRSGNFATTRAASGQLIQIFDPVTTRAVAGGAYQRDPFPGNIIPANRVNPVSNKILDYWAKPNLTGNAVTGINNFISNASESYGVDQTNTRIDHTFSNANRLFGRFSWNSSLVVPPYIYGNVGNPSSGPQLFTQRNFALNDTHGFSPTTFATFRLGFTRLRDHGEPFGLGFNPSELGLPANYVANQEALAFPSITVAGYTASNVGFGTGSVGPVTGALLNNISNAYTAQTDITHTRGKHVLKAGYESRVFRLAGFRPTISDFSFNAGFTQGPDPTRGSPTAGQAIASFMLGLAASGNVTKRPTQDSQTLYHAAFLQDDFKVTSRLTLNLGVRFESENLRTDRYDRLNFLDFDSTVGVTAPGVGPLRGGLQFVGVNGNPREQARVARFFAPRFGMAFQLRPNTVIRGGYGMFVAPRTGWDFGSFGQTGYSATTSLVSSNDGVTPVNYISNPYPNGFVQPTGNSLGLLTNIGAAISSVDRDQKAIYMQQWNFNIQQSLPGSIVIDAAYAGSKGTNLLQNLQYNQLPVDRLALGNALTARIANPFLGIIPANQPLGAAQIQAGQLLRPYPHLNGFSTIGSTSGSSIYHSLQLRVEKRFSSGLSFLMAYTGAKLIDDGSNGVLSFFGQSPAFQNHNNRSLERSVSGQQVPHHASVAANYELPIGQGKALLGKSSGIVNRLAGGWQVNIIFSAQNGIPLAITSSVNNTNSFGGGSRPNSTGASAKLDGSVESRLNRFFNTSAFTLPDAFRFGDVSRTLPNTRGPGFMNFDLSMIKNIPIRERLRLQFRAEAFDALNNTRFGMPGTAIGAPAAGVISSAGDARILQFALKLLF
ncbi:MAG: TonB-dependent receptor [Bryobacteraceae bacterium]